MSVIPWRSKYKLEALKTERARKVDNIPRFIPKRQREYELHHIHDPYTWMCDYFFFRPDGNVIDNVAKNVNDGIKKNLVVVLAFIHCNSRFFDAYIVKDRSGSTFKTFLEQLILRPNETNDDIFNRNRPVIGTLITDCDRAFGMDVRKDAYGNYKRVLSTEEPTRDADADENDSKVYRRRIAERHLDVTRTYELRGIEHISYNAKQNPLIAHSCMSIINRMARTLRDMLFNANKQNPQFRLNQNTLRELCTIYNNTPHATLSKIMGFNVTPRNAYIHQELQDEICLRLQRMNIKTVGLINFENIKPGDIAAGRDEERDE